MNIPSKQEMDTALALRIGNDLQQKFSHATVAICGLGGLGSNIAFSLARAGVGKLILIDFDKVDLSNLNRQQYQANQIGIEKTTALSEELLEIAPYLNIVSHSVKITEQNLTELLQDADVICEAFDDAKEKSMLVNGVLEQLPQKYLVAASGMAGFGSANSIQTKKVMKRFYLCGDGVSDVSEVGSLFAPRVMLCAAHQALTVLHILAGEPMIL